MTLTILTLCLWFSPAHAASPRAKAGWTLLDANHDANYVRGKALSTTVPTQGVPTAFAIGLGLGAVGAGLAVIDPHPGEPGPANMLGAVAMVGGPMVVGHFSPQPACDQGPDFALGCRLGSARAPERSIRRWVVLGEGIGAAAAFALYAARTDD